MFVIRSDEKVKHKIMRIFKIWKDRQVYDEDFIADLDGLLAASVAKIKSKELDDEEFQVQTVVNYIRKCVNLQTETDKSLKSVIKTVLPNESVLKGLKDRSKVLNLQKEIDDIARRYERYMQNLQRELKHRSALLQVLHEADEFYKTQRGEVKVVANAYKMFGNRIKKMQDKLEELRPALTSPVPSPPINAPSPSPENDFDLPSEAFAFSASNGFLTYGDASLPFDPSDFQRKSPTPPVQSIQVINNQNNVLADNYGSSNSSIDNFFKSLMPADTYDPSSANLSFSEYSLNESTMNVSFGQESSSAGSGLPSYAPITMQNYGMSSNNGAFNRNNYNQPPEVVPPQQVAPPPIVGQPNRDQWTTKGWNDEVSKIIADPAWHSIVRNIKTADISVAKEPLMDAPHSPPEYDQKAANERPAIEYTDQQTDIGGSTDVDHRALTNVLTRHIDIDHRNLISLTGSPGQNNSETFSQPQVDLVSLRIFAVL